MNFISEWLVGKGLDASASMINKVLQIENSVARIETELATVNDKLDTLITAPYKQALLHWQEGEVEKCKDKLIEAISLDELDISAHHLYIQILIYLEKYIPALDQYWALMDKFGLRDDLVPRLLIDIYKEYLSTIKVNSVKGKYPLTVNLSGYIQNAAASRRGIVYRWCNAADPGNTHFFEENGISVIDWNGNQLFSIKQGWFTGKPEIAIATNEFVVVASGSTYDIYKFSDGRKLRSKMNELEYRSLFPLEYSKKLNEIYRFEFGSGKYNRKDLDKWKKSFNVFDVTLHSNYSWEKVKGFSRTGTDSTYSWEVWCLRISPKVT